MFRLLAVSRVPWVVLENVPGLLNWHMRDDPPQPPAISHVVSELERLGYRWAHRVVGLTGFGIPQRRRRVFVVASTHGDPRDVLLAPQAVCLGQCIEMHRRGDEGMDDTIVRGVDDDDACRDDGTERSACVECALDAVASSAAPKSGGGGFARAPACAHGARECYECFRTPPFVTPKRIVASIDLAEKRHGPMLDELFTLTTANGRRMCLVERTRDGAGRRGALHVEDAERLMGLPAGWTEPAYPLCVPGKPRRHIDYGYAALVARNGRVRSTLADPPRDDGPGGRDGASRRKRVGPERDRSDRRADDAKAEENARRAFAQHMNEFSAAIYKRFEKLGLAVAVPQARWLGERLMRPYDLKFARAGDGVKFAVPVPGGPDAAGGGVVDRRDRRVVRNEANGSKEDEGGLEKSANGGAIARRGVRPVDDARLEAAAAASGWPDAAYNVHPRLSWRSRFALPECGDAPVIRGFVPLGEFLRKRAEEWPEIPSEQALGYVKRLRLAHMHVEPFVARALGEKPNARNAETAKARGAGAVRDDPLSDSPGSPDFPDSGVPPDVVDEACVPEDSVPAGRVVWAPWLLGRGPPAKRARVFWPALALHAHDDRDQIPADAFDALAKARRDGASSRETEISSDTHALVVYFGDKTYEWCASEALLNFLEHRDELAEQPLLRNRARFLRGVTLAAEWHEEQRRLGVTPSIRRAREARARAEERLRRAVGAASGDGSGLPPPASCGACGVCKRKAAEMTAVPFSARHLSRACARAPSNANPRRESSRARATLHASSLCPQIGAIIEARRGHVGACLTLLRERAVGRRVRVHWPDEAARGPFAGTVASFDAESLTHAVAYDDGDVEPACRLWKETVHLGVPEDAQAEAERVDGRTGDAARDRGVGEAPGPRPPSARTRDERAAAPGEGARRGEADAPLAVSGKRKRGDGERGERETRAPTSARERDRPGGGAGRPPVIGRGRTARGGRGGRGGRGRAGACVVG